MTSKEKRDMVLREVVKPELKRAEYRIKGKAYLSIRDGCCLAIYLNNARFNSNSMGFTFWFGIQFIEGDYSEARLKNWIDWDCIRESTLLPDCGYLHPYHQTSGYTIDGYKNYQPQDMDVEDIKNRIRDDLCCYMFPQLAQINCYEDWMRKTQEWNERNNTKKVRLLNFYHNVQHSVAEQSSIPRLIEAFRASEVSAEEIKDNYPMYQEIKALSPWPNEDKWAFILNLLATVS